MPGRRTCSTTLSKVTVFGLFDLLMLKMSSFYQAEKQTKTEARPRFEACDFLIKLCSVTIGPSFKGILVEVSQISSQLKKIMREKLEGKEKNPIILVLVSRVGGVDAESHDMQMSLSYKITL
jgi:hypothetical protein